MKNINIRNLKKHYGDRLILDIPNLNIASEDKIGIVGKNGAGKSTLMKILIDEEKDYSGEVVTVGSIGYIPQLENDFSNYNNNNEYKKLGSIRVHKNMSGGESTKAKITEALSKNPDILFADEPTANLDSESIKVLESELVSFRGIVVLISHDVILLDKVCNKIIEIDNGKCKIYKGNYSDYKGEKEKILKNKKLEYEKYVEKRENLENAYRKKLGVAISSNKSPRSMGNSEARNNKLVVKQKSGKISLQAKKLKSRIDRLEKADKVYEEDDIKIDLADNLKIKAKILIEANDIDKSFGDMKLFDKAKFNIRNNTKTALLGSNGSGKTTLVRMILNDENIKKNPSLKIGYIDQNTQYLNNERSILENAMEDTVHDETIVRTVLARLLFKREDLNKSAKLLSGGERVKLALAKIITGKYNYIIMDEPTNYLDIYSREALINVVKDYKGGVLFVTHDRDMIEKVADNIMKIKDKKVEVFEGTYSEYEEQENNKAKPQDSLLFEIKISEILGKMSVKNISCEEKERLEKEYQRLME